MPRSFPKPTFSHSYIAESEIQRLRNYRDTKTGRQIPAKKNDHLLLATWNIANLGGQKRTPKDYAILAEIISWFDIIAIQETKDELSGIRAILAALPDHYQMIFSDKAGNEERMAFIYDSAKFSLGEKIGELSVPASSLKHIKLPNIPSNFFKGFDRTPYIVSFRSQTTTFVLVNAHLYFGPSKDKDLKRRSLEAYAVSRWGDLRRKDKDRYADKIIVLGDFNLPKVEPGDLIYTALKKRGLIRPHHSTKIYSNINNDKDYDQIMFFPGTVKKAHTQRIGVFDFDGALFKELWESRSAAQFKTYLRYYISDHRPLWAEFKLDS
ncbi:MAG: endonuclease/exonuclease/phosphatase family protein [Thiotrichaceae bacterium]